MSGAEHHATVDKGLKMKIKRKNVNNSKSDAKHEIVKGEKMSSNESNSTSGNGTQVDKVKQTVVGDKSPKVKGMHKKEKQKDKVTKGDNNVSSVSTTLDAAFSQVSLDSKPGDSKPDDPYDFDAKDDESIGFPIKKVKVEKNETSTSSQNHVGTDTCSIGVATDPDCLGPCEPGTNVLLEGIVWQETENGVLVVNVTWRDKTYVGTLLDATKHEWAPPRFNCDSPVSDLDSRTPKGRAKRGRGSISTPVIEKVLEGRTLRKGRKGGSGTFTAPPSPAKSDISTASTFGLKRKGRPAEIENVVSESAKVKRSRSCSRGAAGEGSESPITTFIECPEPNCKKKYRHVNGLRYHQSHAHSSAGIEGDEESRDMFTAEDSMMEDDSNLGESYDTSSNNLKIDMDSMEEVESKTTENEDSVNIDIVNVVKPTVKPTAEVAKMDTDETKKDISFSINSTSATMTKPKIGSGTTFQAVISSTKSTELSISSASSAAVQTTTASQAIVSVTTVSTSPLQSAKPISFAAITTNSQSNELKSDFSSGKQEKLIMPKGINRPIAPSNMIALTTNVTVTHTNLAPVTTHTHVSSTTQFQPIQPKPTVLGESATVNQHLLGLKELKEKKKHKKKLKDPSNSSQNVNIAAPKLIKPDVKKSEASSVIKVAPIMAKPVEQIKKESKPIEFEKEKSGLPDKPYPANVGVITGQQKVVDLSQTPRTEQPSVLKVTPTLQVITNESNKSNINDDVQSPAYSDISDANEVGSPAPSASPQIVDEKTVNKPKDLQGAPNVNLENPPLHQYGMYGNYYNQSPYLLSPAAQASPGSNIQKMQNTPSINKDRSTPVESLKVGENKSKVDESKLDKNDDTSDKIDRPQQLSQTELQQIQHQKWVQQQMYALQSLPPHQQYQYMAAYGSYLDPNYHMHMMGNDPLYRQHFEKMIEDQQKRMHLEGIPREMESPRSVSRSSATDLAMQPTSGFNSDMKNKPQNVSNEYLAGYQNRDSEMKRQGDISNEKDKKEKVSEKNSEDSKDSIDLKASIDKSLQNSEAFKAQRDGKISEEQARRMQMYKEQKYIEQQKRVEQKKGVDNRFEARPMDLASNKAMPSSISPYPGNKSKDVPNVHKKSETCNKFKDANQSDSNSDMTVSSKSASDDKNRNPSLERGRNSDDRSSDKSDKVKGIEGSFDKHKSIDTPDKNRSSSVETPKSKLGHYSKSSSPHTPSSTPHSPSISSGSHYSPYLYHSQFVQSPPTSYAHHPYDSNMYRNMVYPTNYLHPSLGYSVGGGEMEKSGKMVPKTGPSDMDIKKSDSISQGSSSASHKIHELQEKGKPGSRSASPSISKSEKPLSLPLSVGDKKRDSSSPPTQRHVHTHHHTHVLEAAYPVYHPYSSIYPSPAQTQVPPGTPIQHPPFPTN